MLFKRKKLLECIVCYPKMPLYAFYIDRKEKTIKVHKHYHSPLIDKFVREWEIYQEKMILIHHRFKTNKITTIGKHKREIERDELLKIIKNKRKEIDG